MAYLYQSATSLANTRKFAYSGWFRFNVSEPGDPGIFEFGPNWDVGPINSYIRANATWLAGAYNPGRGGNDSIQLSYSAPAINAWHHICVSADLTGPGVVLSPPYSGTPAFPCCCLLDGVSKIDYASLAGYGLPVGYWTAASDVGGFDLVVNGHGIGLPYEDYNITHYAPSIVSRDYADTQAWFGTYVNWRDAANFAKIIKLSGGVGTPADPALAAAAFGTQQILFKGKASDASFYVNRGNGGAFTKVGTATDFTPGPSY